MIVLFFSREVANVIRDLVECEKLRIFARVAEAPDAEQVYDFLSAQRAQLCQLSQRRSEQRMLSKFEISSKNCRFHLSDSGLKSLQIAEDKL